MADGSGPGGRPAAAWPGDSGRAARLEAIRRGVDLVFLGEVLYLAYAVARLVGLPLLAFLTGLTLLGFVEWALELAVVVVYPLLLVLGFRSLGPVIGWHNARRSIAAAIVFAATAVVATLALLYGIAWKSLGLVLLGLVAGLVNFLARAVALWPLNRIHPGGDTVKIGVLVYVIGGFVYSSGLPISGLMRLLGNVLIVTGLASMRSAARQGTVRLALPEPRYVPP